MAHKRDFYDVLGVSRSAGADEILRRRYASGEINENDVEAARQTLRRT